MEKPSHLTAVGQLRAALEAVPDDTPLTVIAEELKERAVWYRTTQPKAGL